MKYWGVNYTPTLDHFGAIFGAGNLGLRALQDTFYLASIAAFFGGVLSLVIGYMVQRVPFRGRGMVDFLSMTPMAVPGVVIGIAYAIAFNKPPLIISGTALIIILLFIVRTMPFGLRMSVAAIGQIDEAIDEASLTLGANRFQTFTRPRHTAFDPDQLRRKHHIYVHSKHNVSQRGDICRVRKLDTGHGGNAVRDRNGENQRSVSFCSSPRRDRCSNKHITFPLHRAAENIIRAMNMENLTTQGNALRLVDLEKEFRAPDGGVVRAVNNISLDVAPGEFVSLLGPSGCGKTTILRMVAGLEQPSGGGILIGEERVNELPPYKRNIGLVFQSYALFPHMNVFDNITFGIDDYPKKEKIEIAKNLLKLVHLEDYENRFPHELSGGQQQRIALIRSLSTNPEILLLDEPFSGIDIMVKSKIQKELLSILRQTHKTVIIVTHDIEEARVMSDEIIYINEGKIIPYDES